MCFFRISFGHQLFTCSWKFEQNTVNMKHMLNSLAIGDIYQRVILWCIQDINNWKWVSKLHTENSSHISQGRCLIVIFWFDNVSPTFVTIYLSTMLWLNGDDFSNEPPWMISVKFKSHFWYVTWIILHLQNDQWYLIRTVNTWSVKPWMN